MWHDKRRWHVVDHSDLKLTWNRNWSKTDKMWRTSARRVALLCTSALHGELCSLDDECALERYRWQKILTDARICTWWICYRIHARWTGVVALIFSLAVKKLTCKSCLLRWGQRHETGLGINWQGRLCLEVDGRRAEQQATATCRNWFPCKQTDTPWWNKRV